MKWIKEISGKLMDVESKTVFASRVLYSITGDNTYLLNLGKRFKKSVTSSDKWKKFSNRLALAEKEYGVVLYSAGAFGRKMLDLTREIRWRCVIDQNPKCNELRGIPVESCETYFKNMRDEYIVIPSMFYFDDMRNFLLRHGVDVGRIIDGTVLYELTEGLQYFDLKELSHCDGQEVFADVGCCDGMSSVQFMKWCGGDGYCYCFEPDRYNIERVQKNMKNKNIPSDTYCLIPKGAWNEETRLLFVADGNGASHVSGVYGEDGSENMEGIQVTTIDKVIGDKPLTFIKMDIEGSELNALRGAEQTIRKQKPKLAICVYHKSDDIREIPEYILSIRSDYKFYLRHYSFEASETVLYAV